MTKVWCQSGDEEEFTEARIISEQWFGTDFSVFACKPAPWRSLDMTLELRWDYPPADYFEPGTVFTVSDQLKAVLDEFDAPAEFLPTAGRPARPRVHRADLLLLQHPGTGRMPRLGAG